MPVIFNVHAIAYSECQKNTVYAFCDEYTNGFSPKASQRHDLQEFGNNDPKAAASKQY